MARPQRGRKPSRPAAAPRPVVLTAGGDPGMRAAAEGVLRVAQESPDGWGTVAEVLRAQDNEPGPLLEFLAQHVGKEILPLLRGLALDEEDEMAAASLKALPLLGTRAAGEVLAEAYGAHPAGERGVLAWQGVEALQARGINVTVPAPDGARPEAAAYVPREAWETVPDACGVREVVVRGQDRYGVWQSVIVIWNDRAGVRQGVNAGLSQKEWNRILEDHRRSGILTVRVPLDYARYQVAQARALNGRSGCPLELNLVAWDEFVGPPPVDYDPPAPDAWVRALAEPRRTELEGQVALLLQVPGFEGWGFEPADIRPWHARWAAIEVDEGQADPNDAQVAEVDAVLAEAVGGLVKDDVAAMFRTRLLELAFKLRELGRENQGDVAAAIALQLEPGTDWSTLPFFKLLAANSMDFLDRMLEDGDDPEELRFDPFGPMEG